MPEVSTIIISIVGCIAAIFVGLFLFKKYHDFKANAKRDNMWPPMYNACPDYWTDLGNGECQNIHNLGRCPQNNGSMEPNGKINFRAIGTSATLAGRRSLCQKARECGITWEHIDKSC